MYWLKPIRWWNSQIIQRVRCVHPGFPTSFSLDAEYQAGADTKTFFEIAFLFSDQRNSLSCENINAARYVCQMLAKSGMSILCSISSGIPQQDLHSHKLDS